MEKKNWRIYAGLGGGFGGAKYVKTEFTTEILALIDAEVEANDEYNSYEGLHGLFSAEDELEENPDLDEEELDMMRQEDVDQWIEYWVVEETEENKHDDD